MLFVTYNDEFPAKEVLTIVLCALVTGVFALRYDSDPDSCLATDESDTIYEKGASEIKFTDVGYHFRVLFELLFYTQLAQLCVVTLSYMVSGASFRKFCYKLVSLGYFITASAWIFGIYSRLSH
jgi:hypothetical protein